MNCSNIITSIGLAIDIAGAFLLAKDYWRPQFTSEYESQGMDDSAARQKRTEEQRKNYPYAFCGLVLLAIGFIIQFIAQWV